MMIMIMIAVFIAVIWMSNNNKIYVDVIGVCVVVMIPETKKIG